MAGLRRKHWIAIALGAVLILTAFSQRHAIACLTVSAPDYHPIGDRVFVDASFGDAEHREILARVAEARARLVPHVRDVRARPTLILTRSSDAAREFGVEAAVPASIYNWPWGSYIVLTPEGNSVDVLAHEWFPAEISERLGYFFYTFRLPVWFNEGLAMQVDYRRKKIWLYIQDGVSLPPISSIESARDFFFGDRALHYAAAKVAVSGWLAADGNRGVERFLSEVAAGADFAELYAQYGRDADRDRDSDQW